MSCCSFPQAGKYNGIDAAFAVTDDRTPNCNRAPIDEISAVEDDLLHLSVFGAGPEIAGRIEGETGIPRETVVRRNIFLEFVGDQVEADKGSTDRYAVDHILAGDPDRVVRSDERIVVPTDDRKPEILRPANAHDLCAAREAVHVALFIENIAADGPDASVRRGHFGVNVTTAVVLEILFDRSRFGTHRPEIAFKIRR